MFFPHGLVYVAFCRIYITLIYTRQDYISSRYVWTAPVTASSFLLPAPPVATCIAWLAWSCLTVENINLGIVKGLGGFTLCDDDDLLSDHKQY